MTSAALGSPDVPLVLKYTAVVSLGSSTDTQSSWPQSIKHVVDLYPAASSSLPSLFWANTKMFEEGTPHSFAAADAAARLLKSEIMNFAFVIRTWWPNSKAV